MDVAILSNIRPRLCLSALILYKNPRPIQLLFSLFQLSSWSCLSARLQPQMSLLFYLISDTAPERQGVNNRRNLRSIEFLFSIRMLLYFRHMKLSQNFYKVVSDAKQQSIRVQSSFQLRHSFFACMLSISSFSVAWWQSQIRQIELAPAFLVRQKPRNSHRNSDQPQTRHRLLQSDKIKDNSSCDWYQWFLTMTRRLVTVCFISMKDPKCRSFSLRMSLNRLEKLQKLIYMLLRSSCRAPGASQLALSYNIFIIIVVNFEMGNLQSKANEGCLDILAEFTETRKEGTGTIYTDKKSENTYYLKEFNFANKKQYEVEFKRLQTLQEQPQNQNILSLVKLFSQTYNNICSDSFRIYALYQYPSITLEEEVAARRKEGKHFDECELWSILQSCANALSELKPSVSLHPKNVFIVPDGVLKAMNNEMIDQEYRCIVKQSVYYAPEKIANFKRSDNQNSMAKEAIFSLGMTLLHAALLQDVSNCYNYQNAEFIEQNLEKHIEQLVSAKNLEASRQSQKSQQGRYSQDFIEMLAMILEPNPNKRASLMEVHGILNKVWNTETEEEVERNPEQAQQQNNSQAQTHTNLKFSKKVEQKQVKVQKVTQTRQPVSQNLPVKITAPEGVSYVPSYQPSERQSRSSLHDNYYSTNQSHGRLPGIEESLKNSVSYQAYPSFYPSNPTPPSGYNKQNSTLYTDPKLLEMIRKDLHDLNELKKSSMRSAYGGYSSYSNSHLGSSYYSTYGDNGLYAPKINTSITTVQQTYTVNTEFNQLSQRNDNLPASLRPDDKKPSLAGIAQQTAVFEQAKPVGFSKNNNNAIFVVEDYEDGRKFQGTLVNGLKEGHGKLTYSDGAYYEGSFKSDKMEGQGTLFYGPGRPAYEGSWVGDQFDGFGVLHNQNPLALDGNFNYNDFNLIEDFWVRYEGNFDCDNKSGQGKLILSNGEEFHGSFENDFINGKGTFYTADGDEVTGVWQDNILVQLDA